MSDKLTNRAIAVLQAIVCGKEYSASDIAARLHGEVAPATLRRTLVALVNLGFLEQTGERKGTVYKKTLVGALKTPFDPNEYFQNTPNHQSLTTYQFDVFSKLPVGLFDDDVQAELAESTANHRSASRASTEGVREQELERLVIELSWKSSAIEGNTYTLLDTERLLKQKTEAAGHTKEEAQMILNHKTAFDFIRNNLPQTISRKYVEDMHSLLVQDLGVSKGVRQGAVGVLGTEYRPLAFKSQLEEEFDTLCEAVNRQPDPYSKALLALVGVSYLQPFEDGNKRTARLIANALLMQYNCVPLSYRNVDVSTYRESMLVFYEQLSLLPMQKIFAEQYMYAAAHYLIAAE